MSASKTPAAKPGGAQSKGMGTGARVAEKRTGEGVSPAVLPTYARVDVVFERGEGCWLIDTRGDRYLDFTAGIAVNALGHAHPALIAALTEQAHKLWHTSNLYRIAGQERLAERLCAATFADRVFFSNSGAEAMEAAIKMARRWHYGEGRPERTRIITFEGSFHGRTLATIAAAGNKKYQEGFGPELEGFDHLPHGDLDAVRKAIGPATAAIIIEPIQGEGGVRVASTAFMQGLRKLCDEHGLLLVLDEVQTGVGRTGKLFAYEWSGVTPDIMAIAKAIGGGFPVGACLATERAAKHMIAGTHGSTFGGNPLAMAVGNAVLDEVLKPGFIEGIHAKAPKMRQMLARLVDEHPDVFVEVRGEGLLTGLRCKPPAGDVVKALAAEKMLAVGAGDNVVRLIPPLIVSEEEIAEAGRRLERAAKAVAAAAKAKG